MKLRWITLLTVSTATAAAIMLVVAVVGHSLREKDLLEAKQDSYERALLIKTSLLNTMIATGDPVAITKTLDNLREGQNVKIRMIRASHVLKQFGIKIDETAQDKYEEQVLLTGESIEVMEGESALRYLFPFITDNRCGACHVDITGVPVASGIVNGAVEITFDLSVRRNDSLAVVVKSLALVTVILIIAGGALLFMGDYFITRPIQKIAETVEQFSKQNFHVKLPPFNVHEIEIMARGVRTTAAELEKIHVEQERHLAEQREERDEIARIISRRAADMGIDSKNDYRTLVGGLLSVMDEAGRGHLIQQAVGYVDQAEAEISIPSDPSLIPPIAAYLATMAEGRIDGGVLARSVELALEEALANAIYHGNLDLPSPRDDDDLEELGELVSQRLITPPYRSRRVRIFIKRKRGEVTYVIEDEGKGFAVESISDADEEETLFGRGLLIMRTLATSVKFNSAGNSITLHFDLTV